MNIELNDHYKEMLDKIMSLTGLDQEDAIRYLIAFYFKSHCSSNEVA